MGVSNSREQPKFSTRSASVASDPIRNDLQNFHLSQLFSFAIMPRGENVYGAYVHNFCRTELELLPVHLLSSATSFASGICQITTPEYSTRLRAVADWIANMPIFDPTFRRWVEDIEMILLRGIHYQR
jgi:hypothetical protein